MQPPIQLKRATPVFLIALMLACFALSPSVVTGTLLAFFHPEVQAEASYRALSFAERVSYQRAIEEVYWRHRIWPKERPDPKPSFDPGMSQTQLENKVADYLRDSQALEEYCQTRVTAEQLQAEMDRMAREVESHRREGSDEPAWESSAVHLRQPHVTARTEDAISVAVCAAAELLKVLPGVAPVARNSNTIG